jgi:hypothetical protein
MSLRFYKYFSTVSFYVGKVGYVISVKYVELYSMGIMEDCTIVVKYMNVGSVIVYKCA